MNFDEIKTGFLESLKNDGKINDEQLSKLQLKNASVFLSDSKFVKYVKNNFSLKDLDKVPSSISEILASLKDENEDDSDYSEIKNSQSLSSKETTYNKDSSKNVIKNNYNKSGSLVSQNVSVYTPTGAPKSKYVTEFNAAGDVNSESQIEFGANPDNSVDMAIGYSEQGEKGDCWLLSTLNSLSSTEAGQKIIKDAITKNSDGSYTIEFKGVNTKITITKEELEAAKQSGKYATGDDDVTLFELGFESIIDKIQKGEISIPGNHSGLSIKQGDTTAALSGGNLEDAIFLLTGNDVKSEFKSFGESTAEFDKILSTLKDNPDKYAAIIGFSGGDSGFTLKDINGNVVCSLEAGTAHAFSIKSVDEDGVTIVNPWDSSKEYKISLADARKFATGIQYYALDDSLKETNTFDSNKLDGQPTQSTGGTTPNADGTQDSGSTDTNGTDDTTGTDETTGTDDKNAASGTNGTNGTNAASGAGGNKGTGGNTYAGGTGGNNSPAVTGDNGGQVDIKNMSLDQLKAQKTTSQNELEENQNKYNAIMNGTDEAIAQLKTDKEKAYEEFQNELKEKDADLAADYDKAKSDVDTQKGKIDENNVKITETQTKLSAAETKVTNAEAKVSTLEGTVASLQSALASADEENKGDLQAKLEAAKAALESAKKEREDAISERDALKSDLEDLNKTKSDLETALVPLEDEVTRLELEISKLTGSKENPIDPELRSVYDAYKDAESAYETGKTEAANAAKEAITAKQNELNEIDSQISVLENKQLEKQYSADKMEKQIDDKLKELGATGNVEVTKNPDGTYSATEKISGTDKVNGVEVSYEFDENGNLTSYTNAMGTFRANGDNVMLYTQKDERINQSGETLKNHIRNQSDKDLKDKLLHKQAGVLEDISLDDIVKSIKSSGPNAELFIDRALNVYDEGKFKQSNWCVKYTEAVFNLFDKQTGIQKTPIITHETDNLQEINQQESKTGDVYHNNAHIGMVLLNVKNSKGEYITISADYSKTRVWMNFRSNTNLDRYFKEK